ncbi:hypothetical protein Tco_1488876, partial [Tanacetum coccineum]
REAVTFRLRGGVFYKAFDGAFDGPSKEEAAFKEKRVFEEKGVFKEKVVFAEKVGGFPYGSHCK